MVSEDLAICYSTCMCKTAKNWLATRIAVSVCVCLCVRAHVMKVLYILGHTLLQIAYNSVCADYIPLIGPQ